MTATFAELALLACDAALTTDDEKSAEGFWKAAVVAELSSMATEPEQPHQLLPEMDSVFWLQAERLKPAGVEWPAEVSLTVSPWVRRLDLPDPANESASTTLLAAIAQAQLASGQPELATRRVQAGRVDSETVHRSVVTNRPGPLPGGSETIRRRDHNPQQPREQRGQTRPSRRTRGFGVDQNALRRLRAGSRNPEQGADGKPDGQMVRPNGCRSRPRRRTTDPGRSRRSPGVAARRPAKLPPRRPLAGPCCRA